MFSNRVSYAFDFNGPSYALDTACSGGLFALAQALHAMRTGQCDAAVVGGANLLLRPTSSLQFHKLSMLSPRGMCQAFDTKGKTDTRRGGPRVRFLLTFPPSVRHQGTGT
jgi:fatty acid synthase